MKQSIKQNLILFIVSAMTLVLAFFIGLGITMPSVVALEQDARCGIAEHVHRDECYLNNVLICGHKAHTHGENCYLLRLEDNDINRLLSEIEADEEKSLEHVITNVVYKASYLELVSEGVLPAPTPTPTPTPTPLIQLLPEGSSLESLTATNASVATLNNSIAENNIAPALYLNERLISPASEGETVSSSENLVNLTQGQNSPTDLVTYAVDNSTDNGGISTLALGDTPSTDNTKVNVYIALNGERVCIGFVNREEVSVTTGSGCDAESTTHYQATLTSISDLLATCGININAAELNSSSPYSFKYYTANNSGSLSDATKIDGAIRFGTANSQYSTVLVPEFYTVTLDYSQIPGSETEPEEKYLCSTQPISTLGLNNNYEWYDAETGGSIVNQNIKITERTTLYARVKPITATFKNEDGEIVNTFSSTPPATSLTLTTPKYTNENGVPHGWVEDGSNGDTYYKADIELTLTKSATFIAVPAEYTVTLKYPDDTTNIRTVPYNGTVTFSNLSGGYVWVGPDGSVYSGGATSDPIRDNITFTATDQVSASFIYKNAANNKTEFYTPGTEITLPNLSGNNVWVDELGNVYNGGSKVTLNTHKTFAEKGRITLNYTINAPTTISGQASGTALLQPAPTIAGSADKTATVYVVEGQNTVMLSITPRLLTAPNESNYNNHKYRVSAFMRGWEIGNTDELLLPNATYSYEELNAKATNGIVTLNGAWDQGRPYTANFFIEYDSKMNSYGQADQFTPSILTTYVGGNYRPNGGYGQYIFGGNDSNKTGEYDELIRSKEGYREGTGVDSFYFYEIPSDEFVFEYLKDYVSSGTVTVEDQKVNVEDLNAETFTVRWHSVEYISGSNGGGWHVNAILVRKVGNIHVTKTFEGRADLIALAKNGFTVTATNGTTTRTLRLTASTNSGADGGYINYDAATDTYTWEITGVKAGEQWTISEHLVDVSGGLGFGEWAIVDSSNNQSSNGVGTSTTVTGVTFPKDTSSTEWLRADFTNIYHSENSLLIRKVDGNTGARMEGAVFELWQNDKIMTFDLGSDGRYHYNTLGTGAYTQLAADGTEISADHFTYEIGDIVIKEVVAPSGYDNVGEVKVGYITGTTIGITNADASKDYAYYDNGLLVIKNFSTTTDVIAEKEWFNCSPEQWSDSVQVQLYANDSASLAAQLVGSGRPTVVTLNAIKSGDVNVGYETYTWEDLPAYAAGSKVTWSLREIRIGDEEIKADGTFPNWMSFPGVASESTNPDGSLTTLIKVSNTPKSGAELMLIKTDMEKTTALEGAEFTLTLEGDISFITKTGVTDAEGRLYFSGLKYDTVYTITEVKAPDGYWPCDEPFTVSVSSDHGIVTVSTHDYAETGPTAFSVYVKNLSAEPLPETGGIGTHIYTAGGLLLMAAATVLLIYRRMRRKEADLLDV